MTFSFDLISDLHVETWDEFDWTGQPTSPYCVVAGDVSKDRKKLIETLKHLGDRYAGVFYIDGNDEHRFYLEDINKSYRLLEYELEKIKQVVYMQNNVVIINGVAIIATNGWWSYDFGNQFDPEDSRIWYRDYIPCSDSASANITGIAYNDAAYLCNTIRKLQTHQEVKSIVVVSHTLPAPWITDHDIDLTNHPRYNCVGNTHMQLALDEDTEGKIKTWCFGHYHKSVDRDHEGIRYVSNPRGRGDTPWKQIVYYPKKISVEI